MQSRIDQARGHGAGRFGERLADRVLAGAACGVVGLDPRLEKLPRRFRDGCRDAADPAPVRAFYDAVLPLVAAAGIPAVKPNIAFFEAFGSAGYRVFEDVCAAARGHGLLVVADVKRGDIGSTAAAYAVAHFRDADAVTLNPLLGSDSVEPFLEAGGGAGEKGVFVLVRTSNPGALEFQGRRIVAEPDDPPGASGTPPADLSDLIADAVHRWGTEVDADATWSSVGAVVGATRSEDLACLRGRMPRAWFLVPGVGAQGGRVADLAPGLGADGLGVLVNQSRGVLQCFEPDDVGWEAKVRDALDRFVAELRALRAEATG